MFNIIDFKRNCPKCSSKVEWQTKDLTIDDIYPVLATLQKYTLTKNMSGEIHTLCDKCNTFIEAKIKNGKVADLVFKV